MRIGIFTDTYLPDVNGVVTSIVTLKKTLEDHGHTVYVVTNHDDILKTTFKDNILRLPGLKLDFLYGYKLTNPIQISAAKPIKEWNLDLIHVHQEFGVSIFGRAVAKAFNIPLVSTYHTTYEDYTHYVNFFHSQTIDHISKKAVEGLSRTFTKASNIVITPSEKTKEMLRGYGINNVIEVIPTGLDLERFNKEKTPIELINQLKSQYNLNENTFIYVGRLAKEKSIDEVIKAFKYLKKDGIVAKLLIVGDGPEAKNLKKLVIDLNLEDYIVFAGLVKSEDVASYYHLAKGFISASTTETQGLTYIEALASGLSVFAKKDQVLFELVFDSKTGYYFDDPQDLALKIKKYLSNTNLQKIMEENAIEVAKPYSLENFYNKIIQCYKQAIAIEKYADK